MPKSRNPRGANLAWIASVVANPAEGCSIFPGAIRRDGYGAVEFQGRTQVAHRVAYELAAGPIPDGLQINHRCVQRRACCNPTHLYLGTQAENMADRFRQGTDNTPRGERSGARKHPDRMRWSSLLTESDVLALRRERAGGVPIRLCGAWLAVSRSTISEAIRRVTWKHIP